MIRISTSLSKFFQFLFCSIIISTLIIGCDPPKVKNQRYETLAFKVDETLLGQPLTDLTLRIKMAPPKHWKKIDESTFTQVTNKLDSERIQEAKVTPRWIFSDESSRATCLVSELNGVAITPDETLLKDLTTAYQTEYPEAKVQQAVFMKDGLRIHQLMVIAADFVLIKLICDAPETLVFEVDYWVPKDVYQTELRAIESSIGSIHPIHK